MKILHTADLHMGQILYQWYDRADEHDRYFDQLEAWCAAHQPDALLVSGDVFDIASPSATAKQHFNRRLAALRRACPGMAIIVAAGNHDSASRIEADAIVWDLGGVHVVGHGPAPDSLDRPDGWQDRFIVELPSGFIVALPFMPNPRKELLQAVLDRVAGRNADGRPVVMMAHMAVAGSDYTGHDDIGNQRVIPLADLPSGYDYLALGHIHRPQTLGQPLADEFQERSHYAAPVARYSGSALHVSCDERYPHSVSLVEIDGHRGGIGLTRLHITPLRDFVILPPKPQPPLASADEAEAAVAALCAKPGQAYFRLRISHSAPLPPDFQQRVYRLIEPHAGRIRFNPKHIWEGVPETPPEADKPLFAVADLQQMANPLDFVLSTLADYPDLDPDSLAADFKEINDLLRETDNK